MDWPLALFSALGGLEVPTRLVRAFKEAGFECAVVALEALYAEPGRADALGVLWVGEDWDGGFAALERLPLETIRRNTVLVGPDPPGNIGPRIRRAGGLTFLRDPVPGWLLPILVETVERARREHPLAILGALRTLSESVDDNPLAVLKRVADVGGRLLHADRAMASIFAPEGGRLVLVEGENGVSPQPWTPGAEAREPPGGVPELAARQREIIVVSDVAWSRVSQVQSGYAYYGAAVSAPVHATFDGLVEPDAPLSATLDFYWIDPFLPTAGEMRILDVLATLAGATLLRLAERQRLSQAHVASTAALAELPRVYPATAERDVTLPGLPVGAWTHGGPRSLEAEVRDFVRKLMRAHAACPQLEELWVRATPSTRSEPTWASLGAPPDVLRPPVTDEQLAGASLTRGEPLAVPGPRARWALVLPLGGGQPQMGTLVAIFRTRAGAAMARGDLMAMAADLELGVRMIRRAADSGGVVRLSRKVASDQEPGVVLHEMTQLVRDRMSSDGCRVFVVRQTAEGARVSLLSHTASEERGADLGPIRDDRGLLDWVLVHDDWLAVANAQPAARTGLDPEIGQTGKHGQVSVLARTRRSADAAATRGRGERVRLLVPLHSLDRAAGVLEVWRVTDQPYDVDLDTASLLHFAPHVASACRRVLQIESGHSELRAISTLTRALANTTRLTDAAAALLAEVGTLASAPHALLLHHDPSRPGHLFYGGLWSAESSQTPAMEAALRGLHLDCWTDPFDWERQIAEVAPGLLARAGLGAFRVRDLMQLPRGAGEWPQAAVVYLDRPASARPHAPFGQDLSEHTARSFLQYAGALIQDQLRALISRTVEQLGGPADGSGNPTQVLAQAARLLHEATGATAVIAYAGEGVDMPAVAAAPPMEDLERLRVVPGSLTAICVEEGQTVRVLDVTDPRDPNQRRMDKEALARVQRALGWKKTRSWMSVPVVRERRVVGLIKVMSSDHGPFLGPVAEELCEAVAARAAWEIHKGRRRLMLEELNHEVNRLAGLEGDQLTAGLVRSLESWVARYIRPDTGVAFVARAHYGPVAGSASDGVQPEQIARLDELSREGARRAFHFRAHAAATADPASGRPPLPWGGLAEPLILPGEARFEGHLYLLHVDPFPAEARAPLAEAAREVSLLLNGERLRQEWVLRAGLFRHAFLGPAQGLTSTARMLARIAERGGQDEKIDKLKLQVEKEAENIRLWRENQRLYMGAAIEIRPRPQPLKPVIERCIDRYRSFLQEKRGVTMRLDWREKGSLEFSFDSDAIDLALSNLLDNATKYAFFNREIVVGVQSDARSVSIWVEDVGHPIPERLKDEIYRVGKRIDWKDPLRPIPGQGLGLPMARAVVEAHHGTLSHTCEPEGQVPADADRGGRQPYRVRFLMKLPHHWHSSRRSR